MKHIPSATLTQSADSPCDAICVGFSRFFNYLLRFHLWLTPRRCYFYRKFSSQEVERILNFAAVCAGNCPETRGHDMLVLADPPIKLPIVHVMR